MLVYLAGPIDDIVDLGDGTLPSSWRDAAKKEFARYHIGTFDPFRAFAPVSPEEPNAEAIRAVNREAMWQSDGVLACLNGPGRAFGTIREIEYAKTTLDIPVVIVCSNLVSYEKHDCYVVSSLLYGCHALKTLIELAR